MAEQVTQEAIEQAPDITPEDVLDTEALLDELAQLSPIAYDQCRQDKAKLLNVRLSTLDAEIEARRAKSEEHIVTEPGATTAPEPWTDAVNGAALLTELADIYKKYAVLPPGAPEALALWTLYTYVFDAADVNPRLQLTSPFKRCGKTRVLEVLSLLASRPLTASNVSPSATTSPSGGTAAPFLPAVGDLVIPLTADGCQIPDNGVPFPYLIRAIELGPDGQRYALFLESDTGWPLAQCRKAAAPPTDTEE